MENVKSDIKTAETTVGDAFKGALGQLSDAVEGVAETFKTETGTAMIGNDGNKAGNKDGNGIISGTGKSRRRRPRSTAKRTKRRPRSKKGNCRTKRRRR